MLPPYSSCYLVTPHPPQVSAKQKALRQKTLRTLYDTGHALHDVWAGVQECRYP